MPVQNKQMEKQPDTPPSTPPGKHQAHFGSHLTPRLRQGARDWNTLPRTPDRFNVAENEGTPLVSPSKSADRRSNEFYNLLKTPDRSKRRSLDEATSGGFVFHENLIKSPAKGSNRVTKKNDTELKEISEHLRTRLNHAITKVAPKSDQGLGLAFPEFYNSSATSLNQLQPKLSPHKSPEIKRSKSRPSLDQYASNFGNANAALFNAVKPTLNKDNVAEKDAVLSLMSLSSPVKNPHSRTPSRETAVISDTESEHETDQAEDDATASDYSES